jgi:SAM-dependent methyltransferase
MMVSSATSDGYDQLHSKKHYDSFYTQSDFKHFGWIDKIFVKTLVRQYRLEGLDLLDLGCGTGWYTHLFKLCEVRTCAVDLSEVGVRKAKERYALKACLVGDGLALPFPPDSFDAIFLSGFSPFNAQDLSTLTELGNALFSLLKPGGLFIFRKTTDLSGRKGSRMNHTLAAFEQYFLDLKAGPVLGCYAVSPLSWVLMRRWTLSSLGTALTRSLTKLSGIPLRALIIVRKQAND